MNVLSIEDLSSTSYKWLRSLGIKVNKKYLIDELTTHQDYPAISSLADFLDMGNMDYVVAEADASYIEKFKYPLLAHIKEDNKEGLVPVNSSKIWKENPQLLTAWTGVVMMPGSNIKWETKGNIESTNDSFSKTVAYAIAVILLLFNTFFIIQYAPSWQENVFIFVSFLGVLLAWTTFEAELGVQNQFVKQVCDSVNPKAGCNTVLKSKEAKTFFNISISDTGLTWFLSQYLLLTTAYYFPQFESLKTTLFLFSGFGILVVGWSLYTQKFIIKQWCVLCLGIATLVLIQAILSIFLSNYYFNGLSILIIAMTFTVVYTVAILPLKSVINKNKKLSQLNTQLKRWKQDLNIFLALWQQQKKVETKIWEEDIIIGDPDAPLQLTIACNPYCGPCAKAHKKIESWAHHYSGKIAAIIRFAVNTDNRDDPRLKATELILQQSLEKQNKLKFLDDWYNWMDIEQWQSKYQLKESIDVRSLLQQHSNWAKHANIMYTPTLFINGRQLPVKYSIENLELLLPQLIDHFDNNI